MRSVVAVVLLMSCSFVVAPWHPTRSPNGELGCSAAVPVIDTVMVAVGATMAAAGLSDRKAGLGAMALAYPGIGLGAVYGIAALVGWGAYRGCVDEQSTPKLVPAAKP